MDRLRSSSDDLCIFFRTKFPPGNLDNDTRFLPCCSSVYYKQKIVLYPVGRSTMDSRIPARETHTLTQTHTMTGGYTNPRAQKEWEHSEQNQHDNRTRVYH